MSVIRVRRSALLQLVSLSVFAVSLALQPVAAGAATHGLDSTAKLVAAGKKVYMKSCMSCHGANGKGDVGPKLQGLKMSDARLTKIIKNGKPGQMPAFGSKLSATELKAVKAYVRSLK